MPFFNFIHCSFRYRAVSIGLVAAFLPVWAWILIMLSLLITNFIITVQVRETRSAQYSCTVRKTGSCSRSSPSPSSTPA